MALTASQKLFNTRKDYRRRLYSEKQKNPSGYQFEKHVLPPAPLEPSETDTLLSILCSNPNVTYTPRQRTESRCNGIEPRRWEIFGFESHEHYKQWIQFNNLHVEDTDLLEQEAVFK